jgi:hypothetical protein
MNKFCKRVVERRRENVQAGIKPELCNFKLRGMGLQMLEGKGRYVYPFRSSVVGFVLSPLFMDYREECAIVNSV